MRDLKHLDRYRVRGEPYFGRNDAPDCGAFMIPSPIDRAVLAVIAGCDAGWDHVSVSRRRRTPNWREMEYVRGLFFKDDETAMQLHVPRDENYVNDHPHCLHIWRPHNAVIPMPPKWMVGGMSFEEASRAYDEAMAVQRK